MPILVVTAEQAATLRQIMAAWPRLQPVLQTLVADAAPTRNESPAMKRPAPMGVDSDGSAWFEIQSSSAVGTNQWNYKGREMTSTDTSSLTGLVKTSETTEFDLRNSFESIALGGLSGISSLSAIANGAIVRAWPEFRNDARVFVFDRMNDITCNASSSPYIITEDTSLLAGETLALCDATAAPITITLPETTDEDVPGTIFTVKKIDASANAVTVVAAGSKTIDGSSSRVLSVQYAYVATVPDDDNYYVTSES